jgi:ketosteroid isomerase-like protein
MTHPNATLVLRFYEARTRNDRAAIRAILAEDVAWHDPYPPPHGGDLRGVVAVFRDIFDRAGKLTGGSTELVPVDVLANDARAIAIVDWFCNVQGSEHPMTADDTEHQEQRSGRERERRITSR